MLIATAPTCPDHRCLHSASSWRKARPDDDALLFALFLEGRASEQFLLERAGVDAKTFFYARYQTQAADYNRQYPAAEDRILLSADGSPAGRLLLQRGARVWRIVDLAVMKRFRHENVTTAALRMVLREATDEDVAVALSVPEGHPQVELYTRLGFRLCPPRLPNVLELVYDVNRSVPADARRDLKRR